MDRKRKHEEEEEEEETQTQSPASPDWFEWLRECEDIRAANKAKEEAERTAKEEADRKTREEADRKAKEEADRKAKQEAARIAKLTPEERVAEQVAAFKAREDAAEARLVAMLE